MYSLLLAELAVVLGDRVGVTGRRIPRICATHAAVIGLRFATQHQLDLIDLAEHLVVDRLGKLRTGGPPVGIELPRTLEQLLVFARQITVVPDIVAQPAEIADQVVVIDLGLRGSRNRGSGLRVHMPDAIECAVLRSSGTFEVAAIPAACVPGATLIGAASALSTGLLSARLLTTRLLTTGLLTARLLAARLLATLLIATLLVAGLLLTTRLPTALLVTARLLSRLSAVRLL